jgi:lysophospholipase L1-like esterase
MAMRLGQRLGIVVASALVLATAGPVLPALSAPTAVAGPPAILPLGDSLTYGTSWAGYALPVAPVDTPGGYRGFLASDLTAGGQSFVYAGSEDDNPPVGADPAQYRQEGHPGYRVDQLGSGLAAWRSLLSSAPAVVTVMVGTNDISEDYDPAGNYPSGAYTGTQPDERAEFVAHLLGRLKGLLQQVQAIYSAPRIVLCTIPPMGVTAPDPTDADYDQALRGQVLSWAAQRGLRVVLADVGAAFMSQTTYHDLIGPDGVHPTPAGYRLMASAIAPAVATALRRWPTR